MLASVNWFDFIVGGIVVSFFVNLLSNFAQPKIEQWWGKYSESIRSKNNTKKRAFDEMVEKLINNKHEELVFRIQINRHGIFSLVMFLLCIFSLIIIGILNDSNFFPLNFGFGIPAIIAFARGTYVMNKRNRMIEIMDTVDKKLDRLIFKY